MIIPHKFLTDGTNSLRGAEAIAERVRDMVANVKELRKATSDAVLFKAGKEMLVGLIGKSLPKGAIGAVVNAARAAELKALPALKHDSSPLAIHKAVSEIRKLVGDIMQGAGLDHEVLADYQELTPCRRFVIANLVNRLDSQTKRAVANALSSPAAIGNNFFYLDLADFRVPLPGRHPDGIPNETVSQSRSHADFLLHLKTVTLPNGVKLDNDLGKAKDQIAQFISQDKGKTYDTLDAAGKKKAAIIMGMLCQDSIKTIYSGATIALDPTHDKVFFDMAGTGSAGEDTREFSLEIGQDGAVTLTFKGSMRRPYITTDGNMIPLGEGSEIKGSFQFKISGAEMERLAALDFQTLDMKPTNDAICEAGDVPNRVDKAFNTIPESFRINSNCTAFFSVNLIENQL